MAQRWLLVVLFCFAVVSVFITLSFLSIMRLEVETNSRMADMNARLLEETHLLRRELGQTRTQIALLTKVFPDVGEHGFFNHHEVKFGRRTNNSDLVNIALYRFENKTSIMFTRNSTWVKELHGDKGDRSVSSIYRSYLNETFQPIAPLEKVEIVEPIDSIKKNRPVFVGPEDPRIFDGPNGQLMVSYGGNSRVSGKERSMWFAPLDNISNAVEAVYPEANQWEKNWCFFSHNNQLYVSYSMIPHRVLKVDTETGHCQLAYQTNASLIHKFVDGFWRIQQKLFFHLGTNPIRLQNKDGVYYRLAIFHVKWGSNYENYVYTFEDEPPFRILQIAKTPLLLPFTIDVRVVFISSLQLLGEQSFGSNQHVLVGYGVKDIELHVVTTTVDFLSMDLMNVEHNNVEVNKIK